MNYLAASVHMYEHPDYERAIAYVQWRHGSVAPARDMYVNTRDWLRRWPNVVERLEPAYFILDPADGTIGRGVYRELTDCAKRRVAAYLIRFDDDGLVATADFELLIVNPDNWRRYATAVTVDN
jgi:hypothetical protein